ncbi:MAG: hypothetical protein EBU26_10575, partial [Verrucomicrobia bacterium]|nr:hypothetical protein [Verrucomicrobiota bacterium]
QREGQGKEIGRQVETHHDGTEAYHAKPKYLLKLQPTFKTTCHRLLLRDSDPHCNVFLSSPRLQQALKLTSMCEKIGKAEGLS